MSDASNNFPTILSASTHQPVRRRRAGSVFTGVCSGISATFNVDANLVRVTWVIGSLMSPLGSIAYVASAFLLPADEVDENSGARPFFDGGILIDQIKRSTRALMTASLQKNQKAFGNVWQEQMANIRRAWKEAVYS